MAALYANSGIGVVCMDDDFLDSIDNYYDLIADSDAIMQDDELICECFCVSLKDIKTCLNQYGHFNLEVLSKELQMGKSCGSCIKSADSWKKYLNTK